MKLQGTFLFLIVLFSKGISQIPAAFAPIGTRWEYNFLVYLDRYGSSVVKSVGDTVIDNTTYRQLQTTEFWRLYGGDTTVRRFQGASFYTTKGDSVFRLNTTTRQLTYVFNFSLKLGDSLPIRNYNNTATIQTYVTRLGDSVLNGKRLKFWEFTQRCTPRPQVKPQITFELIGLPDQLWRDYYSLYDGCPIYEQGYGLCNIRSGGWEFARFNCSALDAHEVNERDVLVAPNPTNGPLTINFAQKNSFSFLEIAVMDVLGQVVLKQRFESLDSSLELDLSGLNSGVYFLHASNANRLLFSKKVVKTEN